MIELDRVHFAYPGSHAAMRVFEGLTFRFEAGEVCAVVGSSGIGKSTLLQLIQGLLAPVSGRISRPARGGYQPQADLLLPWKTVEGNLSVLAALRNDLSAQAFAGYRDEALRMSGFSRNDATLYPAELSGGMARRVALARAILMSRDYLLLDEPFGALDYALKLHVADAIKSHLVRRGITCLAVTHDVEDAVSMADSIVELRGQPPTLARTWRCNDSLVRLAPSERRRSPDFFPSVEGVLSAMRNSAGQPC